MGLCRTFGCLPREILDEDCGETLRYAAIAAYGQREGV